MNMEYDNFERFFLFSSGSVARCAHWPVVVERRVRCMRSPWVCVRSARASTYATGTNQQREQKVKMINKHAHVYRVCASILLLYACSCLTIAVRAWLGLRAVLFRGYLLVCYNMFSVASSSSSSAQSSGNRARLKHDTTPDKIGLYVYFVCAHVCVNVLSEHLCWFQANRATNWPTATVQARTSASAWWRRRRSPFLPHPSVVAMSSSFRFAACLPHTPVGAQAWKPRQNILCFVVRSYMRWYAEEVHVLCSHISINMYIYMDTHIGARVRVWPRGVCVCVLGECARASSVFADKQRTERANTVVYVNVILFTWDTPIKCARVCLYL